MPTAVIFELRPAAAGPVAANLGRAAHAALLRLVGAADAALAESLHNSDGPRPLTVSNLAGLQPGGAASVSPEHTYTLRATLLTQELEALVHSWSAETIGELDLDGSMWRVERVLTDQSEHEWAGSASYEQLVMPALGSTGSGPQRWTIEFASPVTFRQRGLNQPLPLPDLVFGSLLDRWNALAPLVFPEDVRRFAAEHLAISRFNLRSAVEPTKGGALQIGAIGRCTYTVTSRDRYWLTCIDTLARFAFFSGVGAGTTRGFGQARLLHAR